MVIPDGYAQVNLKFTGQEVPTGAEVTFGVQDQSGSATPEDIAAAVNDAIGVSQIHELIANDSVLATSLVKMGPTSTGPSIETAIGLAGNAGSDGTAPNLAVLIHKGTLAGGRAGRGRLYWPFVMAVWIEDDGTITPATQGTFTNTFQAFGDTLISAAFPPVVLHGVDSPITVPSHIVTWRCDARAATQRRRMRR